MSERRELTQKDIREASLINQIKYLEEEIIHLCKQKSISVTRNDYSQSFETMIDSKMLLMKTLTDNLLKRDSGFSNF